jgi:hypothetical protein
VRCGYLDKDGKKGVFWVAQATEGFAADRV